MTLNRPPVNALSKDLLVNLADTFNTADKDRNVHGVLVTSALNGGVFSGGLHIPEICNK